MAGPHLSTARYDFTRRQFFIRIAWAFLIGIVAAALFFWARAASQRPNAPDAQLREHSSPDSLIGPLLACQSSETGDASEFRGIQSAAQSVIDVAYLNKRASQVSLYFRDLTSGGWFGIRETDSFAPASLLKVAVMTAYYKLARTDRDTLSHTLLYDGQDFNAMETFHSEGGIVRGKSYTVDELIRSMIIHSDNNAYELLFANLNKQELLKVYGDLDVSVSDVDAQIRALSPKEYGIFFRILYNAAYVGRTLSQQALSLLTQTTFTDGLGGGIPKGIPVAHKFGERGVVVRDTNLGVREFHDCGIVYYPEHPYLLCVMTKGANTDALVGVVRSISSAVYEKVGKR